MTTTSAVLCTVGLVAVGLLVLHAWIVYLRYKMRFHLFWALSWTLCLGQLGFQTAALTVAESWAQDFAALCQASASSLMLVTLSIMTRRDLPSWLRLMALAGPAAVALLIPLQAPAWAAAIPASVWSATAIGYLVWTLRSFASGLGTAHFVALAFWTILALMLLAYPLGYPPEKIPGMAVAVHGGLYYVCGTTFLMAFFDLLKMTRLVGYEKLQLLVDSISDFVYSYRFYPNKVFEYVSPSVGNLIGVPAEELLRNPEACLRTIHPDDAPLARAILNGQILTPDPIVLRFVGPDGKTRWGEQRNVPVRSPAGKTVGLEGVMRDITDRVTKEKELAESERRHRALFDQISDLVFVASVSRPGQPARFVAVNEAVIRALGYPREAYESMSIYDTAAVLPAEGFAGALKTMTTEGQARVKMVLKAADGRRIPVEVNATVLDLDGTPHVMAVARDISERQELEGRLLQAQKMEAVGQLAGGIAHDFNNLLGAILGSAELLAIHTPEGTPQRDHLERILDTASRAGRLVRQLLFFSRKQPIQQRCLRLNSVVARMKDLLERLLDSRVKLVLNLSQDAGNIRGDPAQIEQVLMNLAVNARDAMPNGGTLTVTTRTGLADEEPACILEVSDTGTGIDPEIISKVFDPFFTTKPEGSGLGLAIVDTVIRSLGGRVSVRSEPGKGTLFTICLPACCDPEGSSDDLERVPTGLGIRKGGETILVVDDEPAVLEVARHSLVELGYAVLSASTVEEADRLAKSYPGKIDLLLSDVVLPQSSGPELADRLLKRLPDLKVVFMSGFPGHNIGESTDEQLDQPFIGKPFTIAALSKKIRKTLSPDNND